MRLSYWIYVLPVCAILSVGLFAYQGRFREFEEGSPAPFPPDGREKTEFAFARLRYSSFGRGFFGSRFGWWATDYPKSDRQFVQGVRRLTRIHTRSAEQVVEATDDEIYNWPWVYVEFAGGIWQLTEAEAQRLRTYMLRGGFMVLDDTHGEYQFQGVVAGIRMIFPDRPLEELNSRDSLFHVLYDLDELLQVPGTRHLRADGSTVYPLDAVTAKWYGVRDDQGRLMLVLNHNSDVGDAWEWADSPYYPERYASFAYRLGINQIIYAMTH